MKIKLRCKAEKKNRGHISNTIRRHLNHIQSGRCFYCGNKFGTLIDENDYVLFQSETDHILPFCYSFNDHPENLVLACQFCNRIKSHKVFDSVEEALIYVRKKVSQRIRLQRVFGCLRSKKIVAKVLFYEMSEQFVLEDAPDYSNLSYEQLIDKLETIKFLRNVYCKKK